MFNFLVSFAIIAMMVLMQGCGTMYLDAPTDQSVVLLPEEAPVEMRISKKVWFKWWGKEPIDDPHTATIIKENDLKEARLYMTNTFTDGLCNIFPGIIGFPRRTLIVEGNR